MKQGDGMDTGKMDQLAFRVAYLIAGFLQDNLTEKEQLELDAWVEESMDNQRLFEEMIDPANLQAWAQWKEKLQPSLTLQRLEKRLEFTDAPKKTRIRTIWPYIAAAVLIAGILIAAEWLLPGKKTVEKPVVTVNDLAPGRNQARLILADGAEIALDSVAAGKLAEEGAAVISKTDSGLIQYQSAGTAPGKEQYNTLAVPAGGQYQLQLPDGSRVWLNAGSSLVYPTAFTGNKRVVSLTGEAYFEVAKNPLLPFEVTVGNTNVAVLGTHFNINGYGDEPVTRVTLAEGSVRVNNSQILKPGEQAVLDRNAAVKVIKADLEKELAWKNGLFVFKESGIEEMMRQLGRWYNCSIDYQGVVSSHFNAVISRDTPVSKLLHLLEGTGHVHFRVGDKKITVLP